MSHYTIMPGRDHGYRVEVIDGFGVRHTMLGFDTEADAIQWVEADTLREAMQSDDLLQPALVDSSD
jgi:hypothetical protein